MLLLKDLLKPDSNTVDIGCHKGEILEEILKKSPNGNHFAFEPIPEFYDLLKSRFADRAKIFPYALSDENKTTSFQFVKNAPAFSGLRKRSYLIDNPDIKEIVVEVRKMDEVIDSDIKIDLVKIDVEGGEFAVLKGGEQILNKQKPIIVFECGLGASDHYDTDPQKLYRFVSENLNLNLKTLKNYVKKKGKPLAEEEFEEVYRSNSDYYFVAYP